MPILQPTDSRNSMFYIYIVRSTNTNVRGEFRHSSVLRRDASGIFRSTIQRCLGQAFIYPSKVLPYWSIEIKVASPQNFSFTLCSSIQDSEKKRKKNSAQKTLGNQLQLSKEPPQPRLYPHARRPADRYSQHPSISLMLCQLACTEIGSRKSRE